MDEFQAAAIKYGLTPDQVLSIDQWFLQLPKPVDEFALNESIQYMSIKLNLSEEDTRELLEERLSAVRRTKMIWKVIFFVILVAIVMYFT